MKIPGFRHILDGHSMKVADSRPLRPLEMFRHSSPDGLVEPGPGGCLKLTGTCWNEIGRSGMEYMYVCVYIYIIIIYYIYIYIHTCFFQHTHTQIYIYIYIICQNLWVVGAPDMTLANIIKKSWLLEVRIHAGLCASIWLVELLRASRVLGAVIWGFYQWGCPHS